MMSDSEARILFLVPTDYERGFIGDGLDGENRNVEICGFGPVVPAARTAQLIDRHQPQRVVLVGIAGSYDPMLEPGKAFSFSEVACYGVGVGTGDSFRPAGVMGWPQWAGGPGHSIGDVLPLKPVTGIAAQLLTVCAAAENPNEVAQRMKTFSLALAEDMEGFGVAAACQLADVPLSIVRGISNRAGDRNKQNWQVEQAMAAAVEMCQARILVDQLEP